MAFFNALNPFSTVVGQKIEAATDENLQSENWAMFMEICDIINDSPENAKDAIKAIKKRLQQNAGKNYTVILYTLVLMETCVKNCGKPFHIQISAKSFIQELVTLIGPKYDPPMVVQEKVLGLIQIWAETFRNQPDLNGVVQVYQELKNKKIEFPATDLEASVPIYTPQRSVPEKSSHAPVSSPKHGGTVVAQQQQQLPPGSPSHMMMTGGAGGALSPEQVAKLQSELDIVTVNMSILNDMLSQLKPGHEPPSDYEMLTALTETCKEMQGRIVELIGKVNHDEITAELLRINDELNNLFLRHARYEKNRNPKTATANTPSAILGSALGGMAAASAASDQLSSLIDLNNEAEDQNGIAARMSGMALNPTNLSNIESVPAKIGGSKPPVTDEFDLLAQSRKKDGPTDDINKTEFDEMAAWLKNNSSEGAAAAEDSLTSTEFDRFLAERAAAAENLPTISKDNKKGEVNNSSSQGEKTHKNDDSLINF